MKLKYLLITLCTILSLQIFASKPLRRVKASQQSDGTEIKIMLKGDENFAYYTTLDGTPIIKNTVGDFNYAQILSSGILIDTKELAHNERKRSVGEQGIAEASLLTIDNIKKIEMRSTNLLGLREPSLPSTGNPIIPVILVEFQDVPFQDFDTKDSLNEYFNGDNYTYNGSVGSVRKYFVDQSDSLLTPTFKLIGPIKLSKDRSYYGHNSSSRDIDVNAQTMVTEAIQTAVEQGINFQEFANEYDHIPIVSIFFAGEGEQSSYSDDCEDYVWAAFNRLYSIKANGISIGSSISINELLRWNYDDTTKEQIYKRDGIGVYCHEFTHALGLPDFYDTGTQGNFGMDMWSLMDYGEYFSNGYKPVGYTSFERESLGWIKVTELTKETSNIRLTPLDKNLNTRAYKIVNNENKNEYYILENRQKSRWFDTDVLGSGMLIIHVDYDTDEWNSNTLNQYSNHQRMTPIPADNELKGLSAEGTNFDDFKGDLYPGTSENKELTDTSTPIAKVFTDKKLMGKPIYNITEINNNIYFNFLKEGTIDDINETKQMVNTPISVYGLTGRLLITSKNEQQIRHNLPNGIYIFKQGTKTRKVIIK